MSLLTDLLARARALLLRSREEREMEEELRFHLDMETEHNRAAGMTPDEARRRSRLSLGGLDRTKEEVRDARGTRYLEDGAGEFRYAFRSLLRTPAFTIVTVLTLAVGIGGTTAMFSAVDAVLIQPLPYEQPGQLVRLYQTRPGEVNVKNFVSPVAYLAFRSQLSSFEGVAALGVYSPVGADIGSGNAARRVTVLPVSRDYFDVLHAPPALGRAFVRDEEIGAPSVILSHALWGELFAGSPEAIGRKFVMGGISRTVVGVMPAGFEDPLVAGVSAWVPLDLTPGLNPNEIRDHYLGVIGRLRSGVPLDQAQADLSHLMVLLAGQYPSVAHEGAKLYPLKDDVVGSSSRALQLMLGAAGLVLVLVCVNLASLLLVRGSERAHEFALRSALGATRSRLIRQMLAESLTLALAGCLGGLIVARVGMAAIIALAAGSIPRLSGLSLDPRLLVFSIAVSSLCAVVIGLAPALRAAHAEPRDALAEQSRSSTGGRRQLRVRRGLVVAQVALAFVLLVGAGLLVASVQRLHDLDLGVHTDNVFVFGLSLPDARYDSTHRAIFYSQIESQIERLPGASFAGGISRLPATGSYHQWDATALSGPLAGSRQGEVMAENRVVSGNYFRALDIPLVDGRLFDSHDDATTPNRVLISKSLATALFPGMPAVGQRLESGGFTSVVIGVVGNVAIDAEGQLDLYVYHAYAQVAGDRNWAHTLVIRSRGPWTALAPAIRGMLDGVDPQLVPYRPMTLADAIGQGEVQRTISQRLLATFALVALGLAALGLFGVLSYDLRMRTREFGIRLALGAEGSTLRRMVLREGMGLTGLGLLIGATAAFPLSRLIASLLFRVDPLDPSVLAVAGVCTLLVALISTYLPARRATLMDPLRSLREE